MSRGPDENSASSGDEDLLDDLLGLGLSASGGLPPLAKGAGPGPAARTTTPSNPILADAVTRYSADHPNDWPKSDGLCPACGHDGCFGRTTTSDNRWACFSTNHESDSGGVGVAGDGVWTGDALDLDAHAGGVSPRELLIKEGYLEAPARIEGASSSPPIPAEEVKESGSRSRFRTVAELGVMPEAKADWLVKGLLGIGNVTIVAGPKAAGKSTLVAAVLRALEHGQPFAGFESKQCTAVYLSEEPASSVVGKCMEYGLVGSVFQVRQDFDPALKFSDHMEGAVGEAKRRGARLIVVDTWARFARLKGDGEKDASTVQAIIEHALAAAAQGFAVAILHHFKKGAAESDEAGEAIRGSSALAAAADILVEVRRLQDEPKGPRRVLAFVSRFRETPTEDVVVELVDNEYRRIGSRVTVRLNRARTRVLEVLGKASEPITREDLKEACGGKTDDFSAALGDLVKEGLVTRSGTGKRGDAYLYKLNSTGTPSPSPLALPLGEGDSKESIPVSLPPPYRGEGNEEDSVGQGGNPDPNPAPPGRKSVRITRNPFVDGAALDPNFDLFAPTSPPHVCNEGTSVEPHHPDEGDHGSEETGSDDPSPDPGATP